jgi:hypothetical protein
MNLRKFFQEEQQAAHERYNSADAKNFYADGGDAYSFADGDEMNFYADAPDAPQVAQVEAAPKSVPIILEIANSTTGDISDVELFNSEKNVGSATYNLATGITCVMGVSGYTYYQLLQRLMSEPMIVGLTMLQGSGTSSTTQVLSTFTLKKSSPTGDLLQRVFSPVTDAYQYQTTVTYVRTAYRIDGSTGLIFAKIYASTTLKLYLYPSRVLVPSQSLTSNAMNRTMSSPKITVADKKMLT